MIGRVLKDLYEVERELGEGGPSIVYGGRDRLMDMPVAIKMLKTEEETQLVSPDRFLREARTQARLVHQNIVAIRAIIEEDNQYFIVMEFVDGGDLEELIRGSVSLPRLPLEVAHDIFIQVLAGLGHAHEQGVVHRDIKTSNIMITHQGRAKLADFGIAKSVQDNRLTQTGAVIGSPLYMSPEQIRGLEIDLRSDIYSLGITFFEMLVGKPPFPKMESAQHDLFEVMRSHIMETSPTLAACGVQAPPQLEEVLEKSLAKNPEERFQSCEAFAKALTAALAPLGVSARGDHTRRVEAYLESPQTTHEAPATGATIQSSSTYQPLPTEAIDTTEHLQPPQPAPMAARGSLLLIVVGLVLFGAMGLYWLVGGKRKPPASLRRQRGQMTQTQPKPRTPNPKQPKSTKKPQRRAQPQKRPDPIRHPEPIRRPDPIKPSLSGVPSVRPDGGLAPRPQPRVREASSLPPAGSPPEGVKDRQSLVKIRGGCFAIGHASARHASVKRVCVGGFWLDRFEVTVKDYLKCMRARACRAGRMGIWRQSRNEPVHGVTWEMARTFCRWMGKRLPTEAEWEWAARGKAGRTYPWGERRPSCRMAQYKRCVWNTTAVGARHRSSGKTPEGVYDLAGSVEEWVQDCYSADAYTRLSSATPFFSQKRCRTHVVRGGSWDSPGRKLKSYLRWRRRRPTKSTGFRCAWGTISFSCAP